MYLETMVEEPVKTTRRQRAAARLRKRSAVSAPSSSRDLPFDPDELEGYDWTGTQQYYITAEFAPEELEEEILFVLGDGEYYGRWVDSYCATLAIFAHDTRAVDGQFLLSSFFTFSLETLLPSAT